MLQLLERYAHFASRVATSIVPVEPFSSWLTGLLFAPVVVAIAVICGYALIPIMFLFLVGLKLIEKLVGAVWPSALWAQAVLGLVVFAASSAFLVFLRVRLGRNKSGS